MRGVEPSLGGWGGIPLSLMNMLKEAKNTDLMQRECAAEVTHVLPESRVHQKFKVHFEMISL